MKRAPGAILRSVKERDCTNAPQKLGPASSMDWLTNTISCQIN